MVLLHILIDAISESLLSAHACIGGGGVGGGGGILSANAWSAIMNSDLLSKTAKCAPCTSIVIMKTGDPQRNLSPYFESKEPNQE